MKHRLTKTETAVLLACPLDVWFCADELAPRTRAPMSRENLNNVLAQLGRLGVLIRASESRGPKKGWRRLWFVDTPYVLEGKRAVVIVDDDAGGKGGA